MRVLEITGGTAVEYTKSMLAARQVVSDAGYGPDDNANNEHDDVWDFGVDDNGDPDIRVVWGTSPAPTHAETAEIADMLVDALIMMR